MSDHIEAPATVQGALLNSEESLAELVPAEAAPVDAVTNQSRTMRALQYAALAAEILPITNEGARLAIYGAAEATSRNPIIGALAAGLPTAVIEGASGLATAALLATPQAERAIAFINEKAQKIGIPTDHKLSLGAKAWWTFMGGAPLGMLIEQWEDPARTQEQNEKYTMLTTAWQAGALAVIGAAGSEVVKGVLEKPLEAGLVATGIASVAAAGLWLKRKAQIVTARIRSGALTLDYSSEYEPHPIIGKKEDKSFEVEHAAELAEYELYAKLLREANKESPQHQGLTREDFVSALQDPRVYSTLVEREGTQFQLPQLSPVSLYEWLNKDFYRKEFSEEYDNGNLLHFISLPNISPSVEVRDRLSRLADRNGVLVFDFPSSDPEYPDRVQALLDELGIQGYEAEIMGTQTYFAGQAKLKRGLDPRRPRLGLTQAFEQLIADGEYDLACFDNGASLQTRIDNGEANHMRRFYEEAYEDLNDHPCNQGLDPQQFFDMLTNQRWVTKIVNRYDTETIALVLLSSKLEDLDWVNAEYYKEHFPDKAATDQIVWFPGLAADPNRPEKHNLQAMVNLLAKIAEEGNNDMLVVFDCCDKNTSWMGIALNDMINRTKEAAIDIQPFAEQTYCAVRLKPKQ